MVPFSDEPDYMDEPMESDGYREPEPRGGGLLTLVWVFLAAAVLSNIFAWALGF